MSSRSKDPPRLVIEHVTPQLDGGRYPIKRIAGSLVEVGADIFKDGHDLIAARILYRHNAPARGQAPQEREWRSAPLSYQFNPDRWYGSFRADRHPRRPRT